MSDLNSSKKNLAMSSNPINFFSDPNSRHQNIVNDDEKSLLRFDEYFVNMKNYFYSQINNYNKIISNKEELLYEFKGPNKRFLSIKVLLLNIIKSFDKDNQKLIKNIYSLLLSQLKDMEFYTNDSPDITTDMLIFKTCKFYEEEFISMVKNSDEGFNSSNDKLMENYSQKIKTIEKYVKNKVYAKFHKKAIKNIDLFLQWANFYYLIRCGYLEDLLVYLSNFFNIDRDIKLFHNIFKQIREKQEIDSFEYQKLIDLIKTNENDENIFKQACFVYITKVDYRISPLLLETYDEFLWFNLRLILEDANFIKLKHRNRSVNYMTLKKIQDFVLQNKASLKNTNTYEPHLQLVKVSK